MSIKRCYQEECSEVYSKYKCVRYLEKRLEWSNLYIKMSTLEEYWLQQKYDIHKKYEHRINELIKLKGIIPNHEFNQRMNEIKNEKKEKISKIKRF